MHLPCAMVSSGMGYKIGSDSRKARESRWIRETHPTRRSTEVQEKEGYIARSCMWDSFPLFLSRPALPNAIEKEREIRGKEKAKEKRREEVSTNILRRRVYSPFYAFATRTFMHSLLRAGKRLLIPWKHGAYEREEETTVMAELGRRVAKDGLM